MKRYRVTSFNVMHNIGRSIVSHLQSVFRVAGSIIGGRCHKYSFVATNILLMAAPATDREVRGGHVVHASAAAFSDSSEASSLSRARRHSHSNVTEQSQRTVVMNTLI